MTTTRRPYPALAATLFLVGGSAAPAAETLTGFDCLIEPRSVTEVSTREEGVLSRILVGRGELVTEGQPVAELESGVERAALALWRARANMRAEIEEAEVSLEFSERQAQRSQDLFAKKAISFNDKDQAETEARRAELQLQQVHHRKRIAELELKRAEAQLRRRVVRSPLGGVVVERLLDVGELVEDRPILKIASIDPLSVEIIVPVEHYGRLEVGMQAEVLPRYPGASVKGATISVVDRVIDAASNTFGVRLELPNPNRDIPGGVRCEVHFKP